MNALLTQFIAEAREALEGIAGKLMQLEKTPGDTECMNELFRLVHTLKGSSGLFTFPEMTRVLHAGEDLMDIMRKGTVCYSQKIADQMLDTMDFISILLDEIESTEVIDPSHSADSAKLAARLRALMGQGAATGTLSEVPPKNDTAKKTQLSNSVLASTDGGAEMDEFLKVKLPETVKVLAAQRVADGDTLRWVVYTPLAECFFQGDDPFFCARQTPELLFGTIAACKPWQELGLLDAYSCNLVFTMLVAATENELAEHFRYVIDQVKISVADMGTMILAQNAVDSVGSPTIQDEQRMSGKALCAESAKALEYIVAVQRKIFSYTDTPAWFDGRLRAGAATIAACQRASQICTPKQDIGVALGVALAQKSGKPVIDWIDTVFGAEFGLVDTGNSLCVQKEEVSTAGNAGISTVEFATNGSDATASAFGDDGPKFGRRAEDKIAARVLKVDQAKIDTLMNLIGEIVVSKNALPYLAQRAENQFSCRELSREIKAQYAVINRITEALQDAIMQVRMMPVSTVFQRFPRLVRDISRKLGKEVELVLEGEDTEADKNIIESLADPLIHIVRNSLDHGLELPDVRAATGKPATGTLKIRASQEADRVLIEILDDGKGINPAVIKQKALEKGVIDAVTFEKISDTEAINLVFVAGFSTAETVSDLSGRGVGMDVVRTAVSRVNGSIDLQSQLGKGTTIRISLPLSMAVTKMMIVESDNQIFGVPMDTVVETIRIPLNQITTIKHTLTTVLRGRVLPLKSLNTLLKIDIPPKQNADHELAILVVRIGTESVGLIVDSFRDSLDVIQKPLSSVLSGLSVYSGSALMGNGTVLMILNVKEMI